MGYPVTRATVADQSGGYATSHNITLPAGQAGDYFLVAISVTGSYDPTSVSGLTVLQDINSGSSSGLRMLVGYKAAASTFSEVITATSSDPTYASWIAYRISGITESHISYDVGNSNSVDPPLLTTASAKAYRWFLLGAWETGDAITSYPFANDQLTSAALSYVATAGCRIDAFVDSLDSAAFDIPNDSAWCSATVAITDDSAGGSGAATDNPDSGYGVAYPEYPTEVSSLEGADACSSSAQVQVHGATSTSEASDSCASSGGIAGVGAASVSESADSCDASGSIHVNASSSSTESADAGVVVGNRSVSGTCSVWEGADSDAVAGNVEVSSASAAAESPDIAASSTSPSITGSVAASEAADIAAVAGRVTVVASSAAVEPPDSPGVSGSIGIVSSAACQESYDSVVTNAFAGSDSYATAVETTDSCSASAQIEVVGGASCIEYPDASSMVSPCSVLRVYSGGVWVAKTVKIYSGGVWVEVSADKVKVFNGTSWVSC